MYHDLSRWPADRRRDPRHQGGVVYLNGELRYWKADGDVEAPAHPTCAADDMVKTLREGQTLWCDGHEGRKSLALVRAVYESALDGEKLIAFEGW